MVEGMVSRLAALHLKSTLASVWFPFSRTWSSWEEQPLRTCQALGVQASEYQCPGACWECGLLCRLAAGGQIRPLCLSAI